MVDLWLPVALLYTISSISHRVYEFGMVAAWGREGRKVVVVVVGMKVVVVAAMAAGETNPSAPVPVCGIWWQSFDPALFSHLL